MNRLSSISVSLGIIIAGLLLSNAILSFKKMDHSIEVRGLAERVVDANEATWQVMFSASSNDITDVSNKIAAAQKNVLDFLAAQGFTPEEIQKEPVSISDSMAQEYGTPRALRYAARGSIIVLSQKVNEIGLTSQKSEELLKKGVVLTGSNLTYYFTALNSIKPEMLVEATKNAQEAAQSFAQTSGTKVGKIKSATQGVFSISSPYADYDVPTSLKKKVRVVTQMRFSVN
ncbi:MAG: SIMPL domain-containing protein [Proteobacteria bacterium]|jgi:hypothetical protein|nr:SIMPL domain-containing protein [Pseudomonadota bacterium]